MQSDESISKNRRPRGRLLPVLCLLLIGVFVSVSLVRQGGAVQEIKKASLSVQGPRPVAKAIETLECRCGCVITYEDPRFVHFSEIADVTAQVRRDLDKFPPGQAPKVFIPKSGVVTIEYDDLPTTRRPEGMAIVVRQLLDAHSAKGNAGQFRVEVSGQIIHVIPTAIRNERGEVASQESALDARITLPVEERRGIQTLDAICAAIGQATQTKVIVGNIPLNLFFQHRGREGGVNQKARDVLVSLLESTKSGASLSWQLLYDPGLKMYALNIHGVSQLP